MKRAGKPEGSPISSPSLAPDSAAYISRQVIFDQRRDDPEPPFRFAFAIQQF